jgi:hypothetical protein
MPFYLKCTYKTLFFQVILLQTSVFFDFLLRLPTSLFLCDPRLATLMIHNFYAGGITKF